MSRLTLKALEAHRAAQLGRLGQAMNDTNAVYWGAGSMGPEAVRDAIVRAQMELADAELDEGRLGAPGIAELDEMQKEKKTTTKKKASAKTKKEKSMTVAELKAALEARGVPFVNGRLKEYYLGLYNAAPVPSAKKKIEKKKKAPKKKAEAKAAAAPKPKKAAPKKPKKKASSAVKVLRVTRLRSPPGGCC